MEQPNLLSNIYRIALYYKHIDGEIFNDQNFNELLKLIQEDSYRHKMVYALYSDVFMLKNNLFIPYFHTLYLAHMMNHVVISNIKDLWLLDIFPNNKYYTRNSEITHDKVKIINNIKDIII
jgi:hypothetical protein